MFAAADVADLDHLTADQLRELWTDIHTTLIGGPGDPMSRPEVAQRLGWDRTQVRRVEERALEKLRAQAREWGEAA